MYLLGTKYIQKKEVKVKKEIIINGMSIIFESEKIIDGYQVTDEVPKCTHEEFVNFHDHMLFSLKNYRMNKSSEPNYFYLYDSTKENIEEIKENIEKSIKDIIEKEKLKELGGYNLEDEASTFFGVYDNVVIIKGLDNVETFVSYLAMVKYQDEFENSHSAAEDDKIKCAVVARFLRKPYQFLYDYANLANGKPLDDDPKKRRFKK